MDQSWMNESRMSPACEEAWSGRKPVVDHFRIFGCIAYAHILDKKRSKLDDKGEKCIFLGVSDQSKAYKLYNPTTKKIIISRDVVFDEERFWENNIDETKQILANFDEDNEDEEFQTRDLEEQRIPAITVEDERPQRARRRLAWMSDCEVTGIEDPITHSALFSNCDPTTFKSAIKEISNNSCSKNGRR